MAACGSLQHIFENPLTENPSLLESLSSWNQIKPAKPVEQSSFTEIFGELHFKGHSQPSSSFHLPMSSSSSPSLFSVDSSTESESTKLYKSDAFTSSDAFFSTQKHQYTDCHKHGDGFLSMKSESLQLCTEGLGSESSFDVEDMKSEMNEEWQSQEEKVSTTKHSISGNLCSEFRRSRANGGAFPPPISCIGKAGKPWVCFKSYREDGRFVLKEIRVPTQEFLHACREGGRLKLHFIQPNDEDDEEQEVEDQDEDEENEEQSINDNKKGEEGELEDISKNEVKQ